MSNAGIKKKKAMGNGMVTEELLYRIDNMDDQLDYNPYKPGKKLLKNNEQLFSEEDYINENTEASDEEYTEEDNIKTVTLILIIGIVLISMLGLLVYTFIYQ